VTTGTEQLLEALRLGEAATWLRPSSAARSARGLPVEEIQDVRLRFARFAPALAALFPESAWDGLIASPLLRARCSVPPASEVWIKADHMLPMTGSVKARGGVYELLCSIEDYALERGLLAPGVSTAALATAAARAELSRHRVIVASTGNLGFSVGLVGRAFGVSVEIHMSSDAKRWKKDRLRALGARVVEHSADYEGAVAAARTAAARSGAYFIDDERSRRLFAGYAAAGHELARQLAASKVVVSPTQPLVVYLPCGVGGAPGGVTAGLLHEFGDALIVVFVEPTASACMLVALATGLRQSVYAVGLDNGTIADGLAVPTASELALELIGSRIDASVAVPDHAMVAWVRRLWREDRLRLEPSGAAGFAAVARFLGARERRGDRSLLGATHVVWTTGGSLLPDAEFVSLIA
jgi:D-serine dehydratase